MKRFMVLIVCLVAACSWLTTTGCGEKSTQQKLEEQSQKMEQNAEDAAKDLTKKLPTGTSTSQDE